MIKRTLIIIFSLIIIIYLIYGRKHWFSEFEEQVKIGSNSYYSNTLDLSSAQTITWKISEYDWNYNDGQAYVSLILQKKDGISYEKKDLKLKVKVDAYAIVKNDKAWKDKKVNRIIKNSYFSTDEPLSPESKIWESWGKNEVEFGLCGVYRHSFEDLYIELTILEPDLNLSKSEPKLKIVGKHDPALFGPIILFRLIRDIGLIISILFIIIVNILLWKLGNL